MQGWKVITETEEYKFSTLEQAMEYIKVAKLKEGKLESYELDEVESLVAELFS